MSEISEMWQELRQEFVADLRSRENGRVIQSLRRVAVTSALIAGSALSVAAFEVATEMGDPRPAVLVAAATGSWALSIATINTLPSAALALETVTYNATEQARRREEDEDM